MLKQELRNLHFFMITPHPELALLAIDSGVDKIMVDMEINGKVERQGHLNTLISGHSIEDVYKISKVVPTECIVVRINPLHSDSISEIEAVVKAGAGGIMLPMFRSAAEVKDFLKIVDGRVRCYLLVETLGALESYRHWIYEPGIDQIHIGLNDLQIELNSKFMFQSLVDGLLDNLCSALRENNIQFGIGGIARFGEGLLSAELVLTEHARLGSNWTILSRTFLRGLKDVNEIEKQMNLRDELKLLQDEFKKQIGYNQEFLAQQHKKIKRLVDKIVSSI